MDRSLPFTPRGGPGGAWLDTAAPNGVILNARAFTSARKDLAWSGCAASTHQILHSAENRLRSGLGPNLGGSEY
jgi:hypothetical protein